MNWPIKYYIIWNLIFVTEILLLLEQKSYKPQMISFWFRRNLKLQFALTMWWSKFNTRTFIPKRNSFLFLFSFWQNVNTWIMETMDDMDVEFFFTILLLPLYVYNFFVFNLTNFEVQYSPFTNGVKKLWATHTEATSF